MTKLSRFITLPACALAIVALAAWAAPDTSVQSAVKREKEPYLQTLKELVSIESGSGDREGLDKISALIADKLKALGGKVEFIEPGPDTYKMFDTPAKPGRMVHAQFTGTGTKKILLIAHMDTVYLRGMLANQPFRIEKAIPAEGGKRATPGEGDRAYGLGISDDKQGIAMILHTLAVLKANNFKDYGLITVLINGDEEISSPASRNMLTKLGAEHDVTFSCEASLAASDRISLVTAGIGAVTLSVTGKASHAGGAPELGRNALYELSHQILQMRDFSDPATGVKFNWTISQSGTNRNVIPAKATAAADVRVLRVADFDSIEPKVAERIKNKLIPDTTVEFNFERRRPPLQASPAGVAMANYAQKLYKDDLGMDLSFSVQAEGGGTDAAFAALKTQNAVLERFGARGFGAHSSDAEYILIDSIEPRMYLLSKMIMDVSLGKVK
jgi:glutamate carboxypeptidase